MSEPNHVDSQKRSKQHLAAVKALRSYISQQTSLTDKGVKHDLISDTWHWPNVNIGEVAIWEILFTDGSILSIITVDDGPAASPETPVSQVRLGGWSLNGVQSPRLGRQRAKSYSHVISHSLRHRMGHIDVTALASEQEEERADQSTQMTKHIASFLSSDSTNAACFSASLPGNYWEELTVRDNIVILPGEEVRGVDETKQTAKTPRAAFPTCLRAARRSALLLSSASATTAQLRVQSQKTDFAHQTWSLTKEMLL